MFGDALAKFAKIKSMPLDELLSMIGQKTGKFAGETGKMVMDNPGKSAAVAGLGALGGAAMSGEPEQEEDPELVRQQEMMRAYGIR